jgi:hypothetical protein
MPPAHLYTAGRCWLCSADCRGCANQAAVNHTANQWRMTVGATARRTAPTHAAATQTMDLIWLPITGLLWVGLTTWFYWHARWRASAAPIWRDLLAGGILYSC